MALAILPLAFSMTQAQTQNPTQAPTVSTQSTLATTTPAPSSSAPSSSAPTFSPTQPCPVAELELGNSIVKATVSVGVISIIVVLYVIAVILAYNRDRHSLRDRLLLGLFSANFFFSVGNSIPYNLLFTNQHQCTLPQLSGSWNGCIGPALFFTGKFLMTAYEIFIFVIAIIALKTGQTTITYQHEVFGHICAWVCGLVPFCWFLGMCVPITASQNDVIANATAAHKYRWTSEMEIVYNQGADDIASMTGSILKVWCALLGTVVVLWLYSSCLYQGALANWADTSQRTRSELEEYWNGNSRHEAKARYRKERLLEMQRDAYRDVARPLEIYLFVLILCSIPGIVMTADFCVHQSSQYQDKENSQGFPCQILCEFILSVRALIVSMLFFAEKTSRKQAFNFGELRRKLGIRISNSPLNCFSVNKYNKVRINTAKNKTKEIKRVGEYAYTDMDYDNDTFKLDLDEINCNG